MIITLDRPFATTERGKRIKNEDFIYPLSELATSAQRLFIVCDGVGGYEKGEVASSLACESFQIFFNTFLEEDDPSEEFINKAVHYTESRFDEYLSTHPEAFGMATTLTLLYIGKAGITAANIGDSRVYQFRKGKKIWQTEDHSLACSWVKLGIVTAEEAVDMPQRNVLTRAISGTSRSVSADVTLLTDIRRGDIFFMCTDGVTEIFKDDKLSEIFSSEMNAEAMKNTFVERCIEEARDNFSFYILPISKAQKNAARKQNILSFLYSFA